MSDLCVFSAECFNLDPTALDTQTLAPPCFSSGSVCIVAPKNGQLFYAILRGTSPGMSPRESPYRIEKKRIDKRRIEQTRTEKNRKEQNR